MAVTVLTTLAGVASLVTNRCGVLTVQSTVMASCKAVYIIIVCNKSYGIFTWATTISVMRAVILSTVEAVVMLSIADLVKSITLCVCQANIELTDSIIVTEVFCMAVTVVIAFARVASLVTNRSRVLTVQSTVMASCNKFNVMYMLRIFIFSHLDNIHQCGEGSHPFHNSSSYHIDHCIFDQTHHTLYLPDKLPAHILQFLCCRSPQHGSHCHHCTCRCGQPGHIQEQGTHSSEHCHDILK